MLKNLDWKKTLGIVAAVGLLFASFYKVDLRELWGTLARVNPWLLLAAFASSVLMNWAKGMRWRALTRDVKKLSRTRAFAIFHVCQMINLSLPALTGQAARIVMLAKQEKLSKTFCATTVAMEVLFDGVSLILLVYLASFIFAFPPWIREAELYAAASVLLVVLVVIIVWRSQRSLEYFGKKKIKRRFPKLYEKLRSWANSIISGMSSLRSGRGIIEVSFYTLLTWFFHVCIAILLLKAFQIDVPAWAGVVIVIINSFLLMVPISPGNIGSFQIAVIWALSLFRVEKSPAAAFSLVLHFMDVVPVFMIGILFLFTRHITFRQLREVEREAQESEYSV